MMRCMLGLIVLSMTFAASWTADAADPDRVIRVVVWDEQQPAQKQAYENFLGNAIADYLKQRPGFEVKSVCLDDPDQGLSKSNVEQCDVLVWWGHVRQREIKDETARSLIERVKQGKMALISLHSAHWSIPFIEAMNQRTIADAVATLKSDERQKMKLELIRPEKYAAPSRDARLTPSIEKISQSDGSILLKVMLPNCCFPAYRSDGKPSHVHVLVPEHPIARGIPSQFDLPHTEMYDEPFHVPNPDEVVFEERWDAGEKFRSGCVWKIGKGRLFYFRPGHETFDVFKQPEPLMIVENACRWLGSEVLKSR